MSFLLKIDENIDSYFLPTSKNKHYLAIKNESFAWAGRKLALYKETEDSQGIFGTGEILDSPKLVREIPKDEQNNIYDRSLLQLPIRFSQMSVESIIDKKFLFQFPSINQIHKVRPLNNNVLYWSYGLDTELDFLLRSNWWYFVPIGTPCPSDNHYRYWIHILRERHFGKWDFKKYKKRITGKDTCNICGLKYKSFLEFKTDFFELHDTTIINFDNNYQKIKEENCIVVCPNCHKIEHEKIKNL